MIIVFNIRSYTFFSSLFYFVSQNNRVLTTSEPVVYTQTYETKQTTTHTPTRLLLGENIEIRNSTKILSRVHWEDEKKKRQRIKLKKYEKARSLLSTTSRLQNDIPQQSTKTRMANGETETNGEENRNYFHILISCVEDACWENREGWSRPKLTSFMLPKKKGCDGMLGCCGCFGWFDVKLKK